MRDRDTILLEQAYQSILLRENPDTSVSQSAGRQLQYNDADARPFGFVNIDQPCRAPRLNLTFRGFGPKWHNKLYLAPSVQGRSSNKDSLGFPKESSGVFVDEEEYYGEEAWTHMRLLEEALADIFNSPIGIIEGGIFNKQIRDPDLINKTLDLSNPFVDVEEFGRMKRAFININGWQVGSRTFLAPAGRVWTDGEVISFWAAKEEVKPEHLNKVFEALGIPMEKAYEYEIEFGGEDSPEQTVGEFLKGTKVDTLSKEEQEARDKKAAEDMAKAHGAAALGTKDKDVQKIIDARKQAMARLNHQLRNQGTIPSLATRQATMTSESYE